MFFLLGVFSLSLGRETPEKSVMFDAVLPKAFALVFGVEEEFDSFLVIAAVFVVVVKFDEKSLAFEGKFPEFRPAESDDFDGFVFLKDDDASMGDGKFNGDALRVLDRNTRQILLGFGVDLRKWMGK